MLIGLNGITLLNTLSDMGLVSDVLIRLILRFVLYLVGAFAKLITDTKDTDRLATTADPLFLLMILPAITGDVFVGIILPSVLTLVSVNDVGLLSTNVAVNTTSLLESN
jgi:hypothetical protein